MRSSSNRAWFFKCLMCLSVLALMVSCVNPTLEGRGNAAYSKAQKAVGDEKRRLEKEAYTYYWKAVKKKPDNSRINNRLRNRFIEMTLKRGWLILSEANANMHALDLFVLDVDSVLTTDVDPQLKQEFAQYLSVLADSTFARGKLHKTLQWLDRAIANASNPAEFESKKQSLIDNYVNNKIEMATMVYEDAAGRKDNTDELIKAHFNAKLAQHYDPDNEEAKQLLGKLNPKLRNVYVAYDAVIEDPPDTNVYDAVNKLDILMSVQNLKTQGRAVSMKVNMYNYSFNPLRLWSKDFYIQDSNGKRYQATKSSKIAPEILDQEHETTKLHLVFPKPSGSIEKLVYETENKEHYSEKPL